MRTWTMEPVSQRPIHKIVEDLRQIGGEIRHDSPSGGQAAETPPRFPRPPSGRPPGNGGSPIIRRKVCAQSCADLGCRPAVRPDNVLGTRIRNTHQHFGQHLQARGPLIKRATLAATVSPPAKAHESPLGGTSGSNHISDQHLRADEARSVATAGSTVGIADTGSTGFENQGLANTNLCRPSGRIGLHYLPAQAGTVWDQQEPTSATPLTVSATWTASKCHREPPPKMPDRAWLGS